MTARQQRRLEQKLARKAAQRALKAESSSVNQPTTSQAKLEANRANAQLSTGPVSQEGKATV